MSRTRSIARMASWTRWTMASIAFSGPAMACSRRRRTSVGRFSAAWAGTPPAGSACRYVLRRGRREGLRDHPHTLLGRGAQRSAARKDS